MYVCVCKAITDKQLKCAITEAGLCSRKQLRECLGVGSQCGKCNKHLKSMLLCHAQLESEQSSSLPTLPAQLITTQHNSLVNAV